VDSQGEDLGKSPTGGLHVQEAVSSAEDMTEYEESEIYNQVSDSKAGTPPTQYLDRSRVISDNLPISTLGRSQSRVGAFLHSQIPSRPASRPSLSNKGSKGETVPSQKPVKTQHLTQPVQQPVHQPVRLPQQPLPLTSFSSLEQSYSDTSYLKKKKWKPDSDNSSNKPLELPKRFYLNTSRQEMKKQETSISRSPHSISSLQYSQLENENDLGKEKEIVKEKRKKTKTNKNEEIQGQTGEQTTN